MKCAVHQDVDAVGYCRNCGKAMCSVCVRPVRDVLYCEDCLANIMGLSTPATATATAPIAGVSVPSPVPGAPAPASNPSAPNPTLAFFIGFLPGLGAFYNQQYGKGMIYLALFLVLFITGVNGLDNNGAEAALWICLFGLWVYMPIDALRTARTKQAGIPTSDPLESWTRNRPIGPIVLIGLGVFFLLNKLDWFSFRYFWPIVLIVVGILMFRNRLGGTS
jgi:Domain of unknown function (DUF5668)